jgi:hypothetical protein
MDPASDMLGHAQSRRQCIDGTCRMREDGELGYFERLTDCIHIVCNTEVSLKGEG